MNDKYLIFFDIDGTILDNDEQVVPDSAIRSIRLLRERGHQCMICTGRCRDIWPKEILDIGFDGVVGGCGTHIIYHDKELLHATLPQELQREIADDLVKYHIDGVLEGSAHSYFHHEPWMPEVVGFFKAPRPKRDLGKSVSPEFEAGRIEFLDAEVLDFDKMALWFDETGDMAGFRKKYEDRFDFIERDPTFYEIVPKGYSKATGIQFMCDYLNVPREKTIGFGDSTNDLPMLQIVGVSVAMGDGNPAIFPEVDYVTDAVLADGIEKALVHFGLLG
ncbi:MAG: Cof-type HAD-IIB family hydrolase [Eubacterium sp.]|nr:Cof-type HAD-IIB family hydrolase [Eubacterium sp.]